MFAILSGKIINRKSEICVCVCDFERENHKFEIFVFVLVLGFVFVFVILKEKILNLWSLFIHP